MVEGSQIDWACHYNEQRMFLEEMEDVHDEDEDEPSEDEISEQDSLSFVSSSKSIDDFRPPDLPNDDDEGGLRGGLRGRR